ncbi:MAG TPA: hypothetical protein VM165_15415 [Planctomycetaceae bacterium]|nr:hypothetical protein [Planctomycetaceae bacterium]
MNEPKLELKLYVVGESSGNPEKWSSWPVSRKLVLASTAEEAIEVADCGLEAILVSAASPVVLSESTHVGS